MSQASKQMLSMIEHIRDHLHLSTHALPKDIPNIKLSACVGVLEITSKAIDHYLKSRTRANGGEEYLRLCGAFQATFQQQDSIKELHMVLRNKFDQPTDPGWVKLRDLRNHSVGHPVETRRERPPRAAFVSRDILIGWAVRKYTGDFTSPDIQEFNPRQEITSYLSVASNLVRQLELSFHNKWPLENCALPGK